MNESIPHVVISEHVLLEYKFNKNGIVQLGGFFAELFKEFWELIGHDKNYVILRETDYKKIIEELDKPKDFSDRSEL